ncbi:hypothetical protein HOS33_gp255 [Erwinia phage vB_EamM_Y3]|uniref:Uncharacterized protein n=1 Tax=Erwinia phage vB_EamM_Y3 TaxID=1983553 RepID=A0A2H4IBG0_9CAUD|nr:hypothetical protein HOS33_gp255 [Erwinia phage vB_EamM_Y3]ARW58895.1 hypothetical protein Y3_255 [Erwinia phage vB_EamM_Y3]
MYQYDHDELSVMPLDALYGLAESRNLLDDDAGDDDSDAPDADQLIALIIQDQIDQQQDEDDAADKQRAEDDRDPLINRRDGQDGSDDYC